MEEQDILALGTATDIWIHAKEVVLSSVIDKQDGWTSVFSSFPKLQKCNYGKQSHVEIIPSSERRCSCSNPFYPLSLLLLTSVVSTKSILGPGVPSIFALPLFGEHASREATRDHLWRSDQLHVLCTYR